MAGMSFVWKEGPDMNRLLLPGLFLLVLFGLVACKKESPPSDKSLVQTSTPEPYPFHTPRFFPFPEIPADNPMTVPGVTLGRHLYYDPALSAGGPLSGNACASCHLQSAGFALPGNHVLPHQNLAWNKQFLWNGKISGTLEDIMRFEVHDFFQTDLTGIKSKEIYKKLYREAFGSEEITSGRTVYALAQFMRSLVSADSEFDRYIRREILVDSQIIRGFTIFNSEKGDCFHCHYLPFFTDNQFHNIGLDTDWPGSQAGRYEVTREMSDMGKFKTPNLRNCGLRESYMHDGRFKTLEEVVEHYDSGVRKSVWLDPILTKAGKETGLHLTTQEKADLVAFLHSLTDSTFRSRTDFSNPW